MAFRVKKRPNALQALVAGVGQGFGAGMQAGAKSYQEKMMEDLLNKSDKVKKFQTTRTSTINDLKGRIGSVVDPAVKADFQAIIGRMYNAPDEVSLSQHVSAFNDAWGVKSEQLGVELYHKPEEKERKSYDDVYGRRRYEDDGSLVFPKVKDKPKGNKKTFSKPYGVIEYDLTTGEMKIIPIEGTLNPADTRQMNIDVADRKRLLGIKNGVTPLGEPLDWSEDQQKQLSAIEKRLSSPPYNLKIGDLKDIDSTVEKEESSKGKSESGEAVEEPTLKWEEAGVPPALWNHPKLAGKKDQGFIDIWTKATESERKEVLKSFGLSEPEEEVVEEEVVEEEVIEEPVEEEAVEEEAVEEEAVEEEVVEEEGAGKPEPIEEEVVEEESAQYDPPPEASSRTPEFKKIQKSILLHEEKYFSGEYEKVAKEEWDSIPKQVKESYNNSFTKYLNDRQMQRMQAWDNEYQKEYGTFDNFLLNKTKEKTKESEEKETEKSKPRKVTVKSLVDKYGAYLVESMTEKIQKKPYPKGKLLEKVAEALEVEAEWRKKNP
jgi:hypothetical protein